jgi:hypothetical protein
MLLESGPPSEMLITLAPLSGRGRSPGRCRGRCASSRRRASQSVGSEVLNDRMVASNATPRMPRRRGRGGHGRRRGAVALGVGDSAIGGDVAAGRIDPAAGSSISTIASIRRRPACSTLIDERMGAYIQRCSAAIRVEARRVQKAHFHEHGTTLAGLMKEHGVDPHDFLETSTTSRSTGSRRRRLGAASAGCPAQVRLHQRRCAYARACSTDRRRDDHFDELHDIHASELRPKPDRAAIACCASGSASIPRARCWSRTWRRTSRRRKRSA